MINSIPYIVSTLISILFISGCNTSLTGQTSNSEINKLSTLSTVEESTNQHTLNAAKTDRIKRANSLTNEQQAAELNLEHVKEKGADTPFSLNNDYINDEHRQHPKQTKSNSGREQIDHALELCQSAQLHWEKGELENALSELDTAYAVILDIDSYSGVNQQKEDLRYLIAKRILEIYASRNIVVNGQYDAIPIILNQHVKKEIGRLTGPEKKFFINSMRRAAQYRPYIIAELKKAGLPEELSWLPLIESGYKTNAISPARALGLWQFIPSTGYKFGLKRNYYIDERMDFEKSTQAAISYLKELHNIFGDWSTVLAAYNCGEGRVLRTIRKQNLNYLDNFWDLYTKLPRETARYVPRFLAVLHIVKNLDKYAITIKDELPALKFEVCKIKKQIKLKDIARAINTEVKTLKMLNPELRYSLLPPEEYQIRIPTSKSELFMAQLNKIKSSYRPPTRYTYHRVRRGDTLSAIATQYNTTVSKISRANNIKKNYLIAAGKVLKIPNKGIRVTNTKPKSSKKKLSSAISYVVKQGDNLWIIARRYGSTTKSILAANNLSGSSLHIDQRLTIPAAGRKSTVGNISTYWVKSGDSPFTIAKKYNMSLKRLLTLNHLTKRSTIYPGQKLRVE